MREILRRWAAKFKDRVFLAAEQTYCDGKAFPCRHYAARFAVKEAVTKAFGTGIGPQIHWLDVEVARDEETGAPSVKLRGKARNLARRRGVGEILVSLAHTRNYAVAHVLLIGTGTS
jgi:holo-[acyl-carrier protein] synthase